MNKAIYRPSGKAKEYSRLACNLYVGCSNDCSYCYCKRGVLKDVMGSSKVTLKACFKDVSDAFAVFMKELLANRDDIVREGGLLFSFSTDPCLPETIEMTMLCVNFATGAGVPCHILTKCAGWVNSGSDELDSVIAIRDLVSVGFTLTGHDEMEPGASTNAERVAALKRLHDAGVRTFASVEPVVTFEAAVGCVRASLPYCDHYKIGLMSGAGDVYGKYRMPGDLEAFVGEVNGLVEGAGKTVYWKKSVIQAIGHEISGPCCVGDDFDMFHDF